MIYILLSTYNGEKFLNEQLDSFKKQTRKDWYILWRDDGSVDNTVQIMNDFSKETGACAHYSDICGRLGPYVSFLRLLKNLDSRVKEDDLVMFADQDDVWLPEKIEKAHRAFQEKNNLKPMLYFTRQMLVDETLEPFAESEKLRFLPAFPDCLAQNVATGCTIALNAQAVHLINSFPEPKSTYHDWWAYIVVSAADGVCLYDSQPSILYRQHAGNTIGNKKSFLKRLVVAVKRGPAQFMNIFRSHVAALEEGKQHLSPASLAALQRIMGRSNAVGFWSLLGMRVKRQNFSETFLFYVWVLLG